MVSTHRVLDNVYGREDSEEQCSINLGSMEIKDPCNVMLLFLLFPSFRLCAFTMSCYWRA